MANQETSDRYTLDCADAGQGCSLKISGSYDEVVACGVLHGIKAHGMQGEESKVREDIAGYIKRDLVSGSEMSSGRGRDSLSRPTEGDETENRTIPPEGGARGFEGRGEQGGRSPGLPS